MPRNALIQELTSGAADLIAIRRDIHQHPEVGFEEFRTASLVAGHLRSWGLDVTEGVGKTGVVATLKGHHAGNRAIGLRADMDALHIQEAPGRAHASLTPGKMHACGHDGHTTMLLGAARYLAEHRDFGGSVVFIFQPAEEGLGGALKMIEDGLFERFPMNAVYGMHNMPGIPVGEFRTRSGPFLAASDSWSVTFHGTGGHGGSGAHLSTDPTLAQAHFSLALQTIVSRSVSPLDKAVVSIGHIHAGDAGSPNIIPSKVLVKGTARSFDPRVRDTMERRLTEIANAAAQIFNCKAEVIYNRIYPPLVTKAEQTAIAASAAAALVGCDCVMTDAQPLTGSEDFSFMLEERPGSFILIGNGMPEEGFHHVHTPEYDFNDAILTLGVAYWVELVHAELR